MGSGTKICQSVLKRKEIGKIGNYYKTIRMTSKQIHTVLHHSCRHSPPGSTLKSTYLLLCSLQFLQSPGCHVTCQRQDQLGIPIELELPADILHIEGWGWCINAGVPRNWCHQSWHQHRGKLCSGLRWSREPQLLWSRQSSRMPKTFMFGEEIEEMQETHGHTWSTWSQSKAFKVAPKHCQNVAN
jgi:hypothetical protein